MTWSIVAKDASGALGVIVASRFFAVGALCPHACSNIAAMSTQALVNPNYGPLALEMLAQGIAPEVVVRTVTADDAGRDHRQLHMIDAVGRVATHTGSACIDWCGDTGQQGKSEGFSVAGNMLAGPRVIADSATAYIAARDRPFAERLITAMDAGEAAGGDKRGKQAAALLVFTTESYAALDLRVDDHPEPLTELRRLYAKSHERFVPFVGCLPSRARPAGVTDRSAIEAEIARFQASISTRDR